MTVMLRQTLCVCRQIPASLRRTVPHFCVRLNSAVDRTNVIQVPKRISHQIDKLQKSRGPIKWRGRLFNAYPGKELISAKRKEFNYYQNQTYDKFKPSKLASDGWKHKRSCGDHFTILAFRGNPSLQDKEDDTGTPSNFAAFNLNEKLLNALETMDIESPTKIQSAAIPSILRSRNVLCAAETGSGKTLAYLLPILHLLLWEMATHGRVTQAGRPRCLVLVPAWELAQQIKFVAASLLKETCMVARHLDGSKSTKSLRHSFLTPADVIVSTPGSILNSLRQKFMTLEDTTHVVIDECDTMLDDSFCSSLLNILRRMHISATAQSKKKPFAETQLVLAGATMPKKAADTLKDILPERALEIIATSHLHRIMPHVSQKFLRLHSQDKAATILKIVTKDNKQNKPIMIFCNDVSTCNWLAWFLEESNINVLRLNGDMDPEKRLGIMRSFQKGVCSVLVCTDIGSRGMDTIQVQHVVNFDFPNFMSDYIHRVGRVGRVGSRGGDHVTSFVVHKWEVDLVQKIERAVRMRESLPKVNANIKNKLLQRLMDQEDSSMFS
ncbi:probable ATP-dependent RNA helicase DDX28 isoform X2 [Acanthaster planci]|uniref:RNA helicase n=1 Tax=Acanthaster planci TaxID=133434 RepID=A0A8B7XTI8_ACAPL|nr:probable ATP-dependent RNA helicase DDX28 isoform X2 [Acanthaster planci]